MDADAPLTGYTVGVTAQRRAGEFIAALERKGATVRHAPTIRIVPVADDELLRAATDAVLAQPLDVLVVMTGQGFKGWLSAARDWGVGDRLLERFSGARIVARGPKSVGAVRSEGLTEAFSSPSETADDVLRHLLESGVDGSRVAVQAHGSPPASFSSALTDAGASVTVAQPYRWLPPSDPGAVVRLIDGCLDSSVDAMAFTSAPAAANLLAIAGDHGRREQLIRALGSTVVCACVGPVTAAPLVDAGIDVVEPDRQRLGALIKLLADVVPGRRRSGDV